MKSFIGPDSCCCASIASRICANPDPCSVSSCERYTVIVGSFGGEAVASVDSAYGATSRTAAGSRPITTQPARVSIVVCCVFAASSAFASPIFATSTSSRDAPSSTTSRCSGASRSIAAMFMRPSLLPATPSSIDSSNGSIGFTAPRNAFMPSAEWLFARVMSTTTLGGRGISLAAAGAAERDGSGEQPAHQRLLNWKRARAAF